MTRLTYRGKPIEDMDAQELRDALVVAATMLDDMRRRNTEFLSILSNANRKETK